MLAVCCWLGLIAIAGEGEPVAAPPLYVVEATSGRRWHADKVIVDSDWVRWERRVGTTRVCRQLPRAHVVRVTRLARQRTASEASDAQRAGRLLFGASE